MLFVYSCFRCIFIILMMIYIYNKLNMQNSPLYQLPYILHKNYDKCTPIAHNKKIGFRVGRGRPFENISNIELQKTKILVGCGVYVWVLSNITVRVESPNKKIGNFSVVKVGMTTQDNGFSKRIASEMKDASLLHANRYDLNNIIHLFNGLHWTGNEKMIRNKLGVSIGNTPICKSNNSKTIKNLLQINKYETTESLLFKNGKMKVKFWSLWLMGRQKTTLGPTELIIMADSDIKTMRQFYEKNNEIDIENFRAVRTSFANDESCTINFTNNLNGPLIFGR
jgi:hypothetical protein